MRRYNEEQVELRPSGKNIDLKHFEEVSMSIFDMSSVEFSSDLRQISSDPMIGLYSKDVLTLLTILHMISED